MTRRRSKARDAADAPDVPATFPGVVVVDTREQRPYAFDTIQNDACRGGGRLVVATERRTLASGDYSLRGHEHEVAIERKSLQDLWGTIAGRVRRDRFVRELQRLNELATARVIVEAEWSDIINNPPTRSKYSPKAVYRSILAWQERFPRVHWLLVPGREFGEVTAFRVLERFWMGRMVGRETDKNGIATPTTCGARADAEAEANDGECGFCGADECHCHDAVVGFPQGCPSD